MRLFKQVIFLQLDATQSSILIRQVVCRLSFGLSVTLRYRDHVLEYFNNIVLSWARVFALHTLQNTDLLQGEHPTFWPE